MKRLHSWGLGGLKPLAGNTWDRHHRPAHPRQWAPQPHPSPTPSKWDLSEQSLQVGTDCWFQSEDAQISEMELLESHLEELSTEPAGRSEGSARRLLSSMRSRDVQPYNLREAHKWTASFQTVPTRL